MKSNETLFALEIDIKEDNLRRRLADYRDFIGESKVSEIYRKGSKLSKYHILQISSTYYGGEVAEILKSITPLLNEIGVNAGWRSIVGNVDFFEVAKKLDDALLGSDVSLSNREKKIFEETIRDFSIFTHIDHDLITIHGVHPLPLLMHYKKQQPWLWRCHVNLSNPNADVWDYVKSFAVAYDQFILQMDGFVKESFLENYEVIHPSIDPLSDKNKEISEKVIKNNLEELGVDDNRPIISDIARLDKNKDPLGVLEVYERIREEIDCQLVMLGWMGGNDPEGQELYDQLERKVEELEDVSLIINAPDLMINSVQRASDVVLRKSFREGFGTAVSEALWKETPVVGSNLGGIEAQIMDGVNGYLVDPHDYENVARKVMDILSDEQLRDEMGRAGKEHVRKNFLVTRHIEDWLGLWLKYLT